MYAAASSSTFSDRVTPPIPTGVEAPTFVAGAIAATWVAIKMNVPAEAARAPDGDTYPITGIVDAWMALMISRIEESSPPGVSIVEDRGGPVGVLGRSPAEVVGHERVHDALEGEGDHGVGVSWAPGTRAR